MKKRIIFILLLVFVMCLSGCSRQSASVALIGGADGPTAVIVSSNMSWLYVLGLLGLIAVAVLVVVVCRNRKKK